MIRNSFSVKIGPNLFRYRVRIEDEASLPFSQHATIRQQQFIKLLIENPDILQCGTGPFQEMKVFHNGDRWVAELESTVEEDVKQKGSSA